MRKISLSGMKADLWFRATALIPYLTRNLLTTSPYLTYILTNVRMETPQTPQELERRIIRNT